MIWVILLLAFILRLVGINQSLWLDEAINVVAAKNLDFLSFVTKYPIGDYHPPGYFAILWVWSHLFGFSEMAVRFPSVLLGVGTVFFTYLLGKEVFSRKVALLAALFLAVASLHVYYSQEARMYSLSAFSVSVLTYFLIQLLKGKKWSILGYAASTVLVLYSDYVTYLIFPAHLVFLTLGKHNIWKKWFLALSLSGVSFLPWLTVLPLQIAEGIKGSADLPEWKQVAGGAGLKDLSLVWVKMLIGRISFENKFLYGGVISFLSVLWGIGVIKGIRKVRGVWVLVLVPLILSWGISFFIPMLSYFRMLYILPAFYLLLAYGLVQLPKSLFRVIFTFLILSSLIFLSIYYTNPKFQREDWIGAAKFFDKVSPEEAVILFENNYVPSPFIYYNKDLTYTFPGLKHIQAKSMDDVSNMEDFLNGKSKIYLFEYLVEITDPERLLEKKIKKMGFVEKNIYNFNGVGLIRQYQR